MRGRNLNLFMTLLLLLCGPVSAQNGKGIFNQKCKNCHGNNGEGIPPAIPPLANSDFLKANTDTAIRAVLEGLSGKITVNGQEYNALMPLVPLKDGDVAAVLNYVRKELNGITDEISPAHVAKIRTGTKYPTYEKQVAAFHNIGVPEAPKGWKVELKAELPFSPTRIINFSESEIQIGRAHV